MLPSPPESRFQPGAIVWGARLVRRIDAGGMAEVWLAERLESSGEVVIKALRPEKTEGDPTFLDQAIERFRLESQVTTQLGARSRHIVRALDVGQLDETPYLVLEFVHGRSLAEILRENGPIAPSVFADLLDQIADALTVAHEAGVIHRDVKPANLLVGHRGAGSAALSGGERGAGSASRSEGEENDKPFLWLADFGVVKAKKSSLLVDLPKDTSAALVVGTPAYASPEQLYQEELDGRSDLWSVAVVAYEALTGALPFGPSIPGKATPELVVAVCTAGFEPATTRNPALPPELDAWFTKALAKERPARFQEAGQMAAAFRSCLPAPPPSIPVLRARIRFALLLAGSILFFSIGIALIVMVFR